MYWFQVWIVSYFHSITFSTFHTSDFFSKPRYQSPLTCKLKSSNLNPPSGSEIWSPWKPTKNRPIRGWNLTPPAQSEPFFRHTVQNFLTFNVDSYQHISAKEIFPGCMRIRHKYKGMCWNWCIEKIKPKENPDRYVHTSDAVNWCTCTKININNVMFAGQLNAGVPNQTHKSVLLQYIKRETTIYSQYLVQNHRYHSYHVLQTDNSNIMRQSAWPLIICYSYIFQIFWNLNIWINITIYLSKQANLPPNLSNLTRNLYRTPNPRHNGIVLPSDAARSVRPCPTRSR